MTQQKIYSHILKFKMMASPLMVTRSLSAVCSQRGVFVFMFGFVRNTFDHSLCDVLSLLCTSLCMLNSVMVDLMTVMLMRWSEERNKSISNRRTSVWYISWRE